MIIIEMRGGNIFQRIQSIGTTPIVGYLGDELKQISLEDMYEHVREMRRAMQLSEELFNQMRGMYCHNCEHGRNHDKDHFGAPYTHCSNANLSVSQESSCQCWKPKHGVTIGFCETCKKEGNHIKQVVQENNEADDVCEKHWRESE